MAVRVKQAYAPLFPSKAQGDGLGVPDDVRYVIVTGGRGSGKSFAVSAGLLNHTFADGYDILFTRFTMVAADISIIPEYSEKIEAYGYDNAFEVKKTEITNVKTKGRILFRGIMQGSRNQTARLKSIPNLKIWVLDEAEELVSESTFNTIDLSIRTQGVHNQIWLILNPTDISHWIYKRFFAAKSVDWDKNGQVGDTYYIHTDYTINEANLSESFIEQAKRMKENNLEKYENIFLGKWLIRKEGLIYKNWEAIAPEEYPHTLPQWYGLDWGYASDPTAVIRACYDPMRGILYLWQVCYSAGMLIPDIAGAIVRDADSIGYRPQDCTIYCDPARPDNRDQLRQGWSLNAVNGENRDKTGRIGYLQGFKVKYVGANIGNEVSTYSWMPNPYDTDTFTDKPQDGNDHALDGINYLTTHLRRMGVTNE